MAKDKDQEVFVEPEFNEKEFLEYEKERAKATVVIFLIAAVLGLLSGYFFIIGIWYVGVLIVLGILVYFRKVFTALHLKLPQRNTHVFLLVMVFFLTWIIFWTIFLNPPISNIAGPQISNIQVFKSDGKWASLNETNGIYAFPIPHNNDPISFRVYVSYIGSIQNVSVSYSTAGGSPITLTSNYYDSYVYFNETVSTATYDFTVSVLSHGSYYSNTFDTIFNTPS